MLQINLLSLPDKVLLDARYQRPQRNSVVAPIRRPQQRVNVKLGRLLIRQEDARVVIKLCNDHGALNPVVKGVLVAKAADPAPVRLGEPALYLIETHLPRPLRKVQEELFADGEDEVLLRGRHVRHQDALVGNDAVVAVGAAQVALVVVVPAAVGHGRVLHEGISLGDGLLCGSEALH